MAEHREAFPRARRLTRGRELDVVRREGKRVRTEHVEVRVLASLQAFLPTEAHPDGLRPRAADAPLRVGIVVPKYRHGSVARNTVKRRLRELVRRRLVPALDALDAPDAVPAGEAVAGAVGGAGIVDAGAPPPADGARSMSAAPGTLGRGAALVLRAHPSAYGASFERLARDVERAGREVARLLRRRGEPAGRTPGAPAPSPAAAGPTADVAGTTGDMPPASPPPELAPPSSSAPAGPPPPHPAPEGDGP